MLSLFIRPKFNFVYGHMFQLFCQLISCLYIRPKFNFVYGNVPIVWSFGSHNYINYSLQIVLYKVCYSLTTVTVLSEHLNTIYLIDIN
jgi:hypothetical protein